MKHWRIRLYNDEEIVHEEVVKGKTKARAVANVMTRISTDTEFSSIEAKEVELKYVEVEK